MRVKLFNITISLVLAKENIRFDHRLYWTLSFNIYKPKKNIGVFTLYSYRKVFNAR